MASVALKIGKLTCHYAKADSDTLIYMLFPMDSMDVIVEKAAHIYGVSVVGITGMDWDDDLTPWPAPGAPSGCAPFKGEAENFLTTLIDYVIPKVEERLNLTPERRDLLGISLSGLFSLWQWMECDAFDNIASISGSFWYNGFVEWLQKNIKLKSGKAYFSLGDMEEHTKVPQFKSVGEDTRKVIELLQSEGIQTELRMVPGNHYQDAIPRLQMALDYLYPRN